MTKNRRYFLISEIFFYEFTKQVGLVRKPAERKEKKLKHKDASMIEFLRKNAEFADIANLALFQGNPVIKPEHLSELDTAELIHIMEINSSVKKSEPVQRYRDVLKYVKLNENERYHVRLIIGSEAQSEVHYAMPVRNMLYDSLNYAAQVNKLAVANHKNKIYSNSKEFLSGITKDDRLIPVVTIVVLFCNEPWDGPLSLHQMLNLDGIPEHIIEKIPDYNIILISPNSLKEQDLEKMTSTARLVLGAIKHSTDKKNFLSYIEQNKKVLEHFPVYAAAVINEFCNLKLVKNGSKKESEVVDMSHCVMDFKAECIQEGIEMMIKNALSKGHTPEEIVDFIGVSLEEVLAVQEKLLQEEQKLEMSK